MKRTRNQNKQLTIPPVTKYRVGSYQLRSLPATAPPIVAAPLAPLVQPSQRMHPAPMRDLPASLRPVRPKTVGRLWRKPVVLATIGRSKVVVSVLPRWIKKPIAPSTRNGIRNGTRRRRAWPNRKTNRHLKKNRNGQAPLTPLLTLRFIWAATIINRKIRHQTQKR